MTCQELTDFLADYVDGALPEPVQTAFEKHLAICVDCRRYVDSYRKSIAVTKSVARMLANDMPEELVAGILKARRCVR